MVIEAKTAEREHVLAVARAMCAAARTAPKARGIDNLYTTILTGEDKDRLADEMERLAPVLQMDFFLRDAQNVRDSEAVVLFGIMGTQHGLGKSCSLCGFEGCGACADAGGVCVFRPLDLGIAVGSAVSVAADARVDSRVMFSIGRTAVEMGLLPKEATVIMGTPLSVSGKSPFFDRKPKE
ncbi:DUF2148 domain-containing protein [Christensenellaceae bacterium OttesenSCG-928-K19]|nr:DUF2148 domain-containing protein [Christensenellaceae bacterium OttesenSCG-928-K19]